MGRSGPLTPWARTAHHTRQPQGTDGRPPHRLNGQFSELILVEYNNLLNPYSRQAGITSIRQIERQIARMPKSMAVRL